MVVAEPVLSAGPLHPCPAFSFTAARQNMDCTLRQMFAADYPGIEIMSCYGHGFSVTWTGPCALSREGFRLWKRQNFIKSKI